MVASRSPNDNPNRGRAAENGHAPRNRLSRPAAPNPNPRLVAALRDHRRQIIRPARVMGRGSDAIPTNCRSITIHGLPDWPDDAVGDMLVLVHDLGRPIYVDTGQERYQDIFAAALAALVGPSAGPTRYTRSCHAALMAGAIAHPEAAEAVYNQIAARLRALGDSRTETQLVAFLCRAGGALFAGDESREMTLKAWAESYLAGLAQPAAVEETEAGAPPPPLIYYQDGYYARRDNRYREAPKKEVKAMVTRHAQSRPGGDKLADGSIRSIMTHLDGLTVLPGQSLDFPLWVEAWPDRVSRSPYLAMANGLLDLQALLAGQEEPLRPHSSRHFSPTILPYEFDPRADCPIWRRTLVRILPRQGDGDLRRPILQQFFGWCLSGPLLPDFQKFLVLFGEAGSGKGTCLRVLDALIGEDNLSHVTPADLEEKFGMECLSGKLVNSAGDIGEHISKKAESRLKALTGSDAMTIARKWRTDAILLPESRPRLAFAANAMPRFEDRSGGTWRRLIAMPFLDPIAAEDRDVQRDADLRAELPGIFNWAIRGARVLRRQGAFPDCELCQRALDEHRIHSDPLLQWVADRVILDPEGRAWVDAVYRDYREWCVGSGYRAVGKSEFGRQVGKIDNIERRYPRVGGSRQYQYWGLRLAEGR